MILRLALGCAAVVSVSAATAAARVPCSLAAAKAAVAEIRPVLAGLGPDATVVEPRELGRALCRDTTGDGHADVTVAVESGGSAGTTGYLLLRSTPTGWKLERKGNGYKLGLSLRGNRIEVAQPVYRANDPNCCPSGGTNRLLIAWKDGRYVVERRWHTSTR
ncbi:MAG: hypothetical protein FJW96_06325 [Actinobacteria bacterium]|nr:hypothetical protein [Actinomycetota bacterium]